MSWKDRCMHDWRGIATIGNRVRLYSPFPDSLLCLIPRGIGGGRKGSSVSFLLTRSFFSGTGQFLCRHDYLKKGKFFRATLGPGLLVTYSFFQYIHSPVVFIRCPIYVFIQLWKVRDVDYLNCLESEIIFFIFGEEDLSKGQALFLFSVSARGDFQDWDPFYNQLETRKNCTITYM